jgi:PASTA domain
MAYPTVAEAVAAVTAAGHFPWVDWESSPAIPLTDSSGNPVLDSHGNPITTYLPYGYVFEQDTDDFWYGAFANGVRVAVSTGAPNPAPNTVVVPNVVGLVVAAARWALQAVNLVVTQFQWEMTDPLTDSEGNLVLDSSGNPITTSMPAGYVYKQSPTAGSATLPGSPITLTLSLGQSL